MPTEPTWKHYLTDYNEGLGLVYERFVLNDFLRYLKGQYGFQSVLEAPLFGMAGVERIWGELGLPAQFVLAEDWARCRSRTKASSSSGAGPRCGI